jgi:hypothetical protein
MPEGQKLQDLRTNTLLILGQKYLVIGISPDKRGQQLTVAFSSD